MKTYDPGDWTFNVTWHGDSVLLRIDLVDGSGTVMELDVASARVLARRLAVSADVIEGKISPGDATRLGGETVDA